jgi:hypothetical protein
LHSGNQSIRGEERGTVTITILVFAFPLHYTSFRGAGWVGWIVELELNRIERLFKKESIETWMDGCDWG